MEPSGSEAIEQLFAHYHARLLATPTLLRRLDALGIATPDMVAEHRLGVVDRTARRTLAPGDSRQAVARRDAWLVAGYLLPNGRERLRGCLVLPLPGSLEVVGMRVRHLPRRLVAPERHVSRSTLVFAPARGLGTRELLCAPDPLDALVLWRFGERWLVSPTGPLEDAVLAQLQVRIRATAPAPIRLVCAGTTEGRALLDAVTSVAREQHRRLRILMLPAGCHLRDIRALHGDAAVGAFLREEQQSRLRFELRVPHRSRVTPPLPWVATTGSLATALCAYITHVEASGVSIAEVRRRTRALKALSERCLRDGHYETVDLTATTLEAFQRALITGAVPRSRNAIIRVVCVVRQFVDWALRCGRLTRDPRDGFLPLRRDAVPPPQVLTALEVERILEGADVRKAAGLRDRAMLEVLYSSGIRRGELVGLDVRDLDGARGVLRVRRGKASTTRMVPLGRRARDWLERYVETARIRHLRDVNEPALFLTRRGRRITAKMVTSRMRSCLRVAGIAKAGSCHILRHSVATLMHDRGADIRDLQALLGHAVITSTQLYTRVSLQRLIRVHAETHPAEQRDGWPALVSQPNVGTVVPSTAIPML
jgi:integrase/recombinase XerD